MLSLDPKLYINYILRKCLHLSSSLNLEEHVPPMWQLDHMQAERSWTTFIQVFIVVVFVVIIITVVVVAALTTV